MFDTVKKTLAVNITDFYISHNVAFIRGRSILFDPSVQYIHVSESDFNVIARMINKEIESQEGGYVGVCHKTEEGEFTGYCKFNMTCTEVNQRKYGISIKFSLNNGYRNRYQIQLKHADTVIPGDQIGGTADECYLPIFRQQMSNMDGSLSQYNSTWLIGSRILDDHYVVYDMEETPSGTFRLGIGVKNPTDLIGDDVSPETDSHFSQFIDIVIGATVISLICLLVICICFCRKRNKSEGDILESNASEFDNHEDLDTDPLQNQQQQYAMMDYQQQQFMDNYNDVNFFKTRAKVNRSSAN